MSWFIDPTYREQNGPDAETARRQSDLLGMYFNSAWQSWVPTIGASSGSPTLGNGTFPAFYKRLGSVCFGYGKLTLGTTTNFGASGDLTITLPFATNKAEYRLIGMWHAFHASGSDMAFGPFRTQNSTTVCDFPYPATWAAWDVVRDQRCRWHALGMGCDELHRHSVRIRGGTVDG